MADNSSNEIKNLLERARATRELLKEQLAGADELARQEIKKTEAYKQQIANLKEINEQIAEQKRERAPQLDVMSCCGSYGSIVQVEYALFS
jgi:archaellum component FlaC